MWRLVVFLCLLGSPSWSQDDPVVLSFAVMGGCRMQSGDLKRQGASNPSSANVVQLKQTLADLGGLANPPGLFFMTGDIVNNLAQDQGQTLAAQLRAWQSLVQASSLWGKTDIVVMPGNHEVLQQVPARGECPNPPTYAIWQNWLKSAGLNQAGGNGPGAGGPDLLSIDQSHTSYSFDRAGVHFVVVNTDSPTTVRDPETGAPYAGWIPIHWIGDDIAAAQDNPAIHSIFMLGHKPLNDPHLGEEHTPILNGPEHYLSDQLREVFFQSSKVRAYLTGHEHLWEARRLGRKGPWEIIIGNGGSKLSKRWVKAGGNYFGFTLLKVYASGKIGVVNFRRTQPGGALKYFEGPTRPAQAEAEFSL